MAEYFDVNGDAITDKVYTQAEVDAQIAEAAKVANVVVPPVVVPPVVPPTAPAFDPTIIDNLTKTINSFVESKKSETLNRFAGSLDADKQTAIKARFDSLTGYEDTAEGIEKRANDAYTLEVGQRFDAGAFNMQNLSSNTGKNTISDPKRSTELDTEISKMLGHTAEDITKYSS